MRGGRAKSDTAEVAHAATDTIQRIVAHSPAGVLLAASWDGTVQLGKIGGEQRLRMQQQYKPAGAGKESLLDVSFHEDASAFYTAGCTGHVWKCNLELPEAATVIGTHSMPVKSCFYNQSNGCVITTGWDRKLCMWDERSPVAAFETELPHKIHAMDLKGGKMIIASSGSVQSSQTWGSAPATSPAPQLALWDVSRATPTFEGYQAVKVTGLEKRHGIRCTSLFTDLTGCIIGYSEGRCSVLFFNEPSRNFNFKCHRDNKKATIDAINSIEFSPWNTFVTAGSDGGFHTWDQVNRRRIKQFSLMSKPMTASTFAYDNDNSEDLLVVASGNDWSRGSELHASPQLHVARLQESDVKAPHSTRH